MRTVFTSVLGFLAGIGLGLFTVNMRLNATGADTMQASGFKVIWMIASFGVAAVFAFLAATFRTRECVFISAAAVALGLVWALS